MQSEEIFQSYHTRMSTIQSRTWEKKAKNHVTLTWKFPCKSCSITHLPFLLYNPKILKAFLKTFPTKMKPTKCPAKEKQKKRGGEKTKSKSQDYYVTFNLTWKLTRNCAFCTCRTLQANILHLDQKAAKSTSCNGFKVSFSSLKHNSEQKIVWLHSKRIFRQNFQGQMG